VEILDECVSESRSTSSGKGFLSAVSNVISRATSPRSSSARSYSAAPVAYSAAPMMESAAMPQVQAVSSPSPVTASAPVPTQAPAQAPTVVDGKPKVEGDKPKDERPREKERVEQQLAESEDYTKVPQELEHKFEALDDDSALRPTIISAGAVWSKRFQKALLAKPEETTLGKDEQGKERNRAFDLLDALTKSGAMPVAEADLHVVIAATHCFEKSLMKTVVQDSVNPIEKVERSALIVATTVHHLPTVQLIQEEQVPRIALYSPKLIDAAALAAAPPQQLSSVALRPVGK